MASKQTEICSVSPHQLTSILQDKSRKARLIDCRSFLEYNDNHIVGAVNVCCSKLIKRRLQQDKIALKDLLFHCRIETQETSDVIVYDQKSTSIDDVAFDNFICVLLKKLVLAFDKVYHLSGGFVSFQRVYPELCENKIWKFPGLSALSQPCLPTTAAGPTRILPFLYLGSEEDAHNKDLLQSHNITYELNVSNKCPKPDFISEGRFMRIPVNDSHNEKLSNFFNQTFQFIEKVRGSNDCVLVHCLAGISRSPTVAIAYVMRHLRMTCEDAYRYVKAKRATISPNFNFLGQLLEYERQLVGDEIIEKKATSSLVSSSSVIGSTQASDYLFASQPVASPPAASSSSGKRFNLSLRICPFSSPGLSSPKDVSPTTAMARLQFDKPLGKENRTGAAANSPTSAHPPSSPAIGFSLSRPTRLQNVSSIQEEEDSAWESMTKSVTKQSLSISFSKGFKSRKSSLDQYQQKFEDFAVSGESDNNNYGTTSKKCRIHKIFLQDESPTAHVKQEITTAGTHKTSSSSSLLAFSSSGLEDSGSSSDILPSPLEQFKRDFSRSNSVSTSGIGSEISDHDLLTSGSWEMNESGSALDDGVFSDSYGLYLKSPEASRQLQLWSSDSGHWSSADEGMQSGSSSTIEVPSTSSSIFVQGSPEKLKHSEKLGSPRLRNSPGNLEKRKSYAEAAGPLKTCESVRPKRWSLAENLSDLPGTTSGQENECSSLKESCDTESRSRGENSETDSASGSSESSTDHLDFGITWFNLLSESELSCCERGAGLYRVHSCPGIVGSNQEWVGLHNQVPDGQQEAPLEPVSDSALLKMRSCQNRKRFENSFHHPPPQLFPRNRFSYGSIDYDELLSKLQRLRHNKKEDSSHSSTSTLASSSFSIPVQ